MRLSVALRPRAHPPLANSFLLLSHSTRLLTYTCVLLARVPAAPSMQKHYKKAYTVASATGLSPASAGPVPMLPGEYKPRRWERAPLRSSFKTLVWKPAAPEPTRELQDAHVAATLKKPGGRDAGRRRAAAAGEAEFLTLDETELRKKRKEAAAVEEAETPKPKPPPPPALAPGEKRKRGRPRKYPRPEDEEGGGEAEEGGGEGGASGAGGSQSQSQGAARGEEEEDEGEGEEEGEEGEEEEEGAAAPPAKRARVGGKEDS